jgi:thiol-disulfide isomerase/thioredoxin
MKRNLLLLLCSFLSAFTVSFSLQFQHNSVSYLTALLSYAIASFFMTRAADTGRKKFVDSVVLFFFLFLVSCAAAIWNEYFFKSLFWAFLWLSAVGGFFTATFAKKKPFYWILLPVYASLIWFALPDLDFRVYNPKMKKCEVDFSQDRIFTLTGESKSISEYGKNKVLVLNIWGIFCGYCKVKTELINEFSKEYEGVKDVIFCNLNADAVEADSLNRYLLKTNYYGSLDVLHDKEQNFHKKLSLVGFPQTVLIDKKGVARIVHSGFQNGMSDTFKSYFREEIEKLRNE